MKNGTVNLLWGVLRILMGGIFFWAFLDKLFGLGFATAAEKSWLAGGSPTAGFLTHAAKGPFVEIFNSMAGLVIVDWLFMMGLLGIGLALILGMGVKIAGISGVLMMTLMYLAAMPPTNNPLIDDHVIYAVILAMFPLVDAGKTLGLGKWWSKTKLVKQWPILQ